MFFIHFFAGLRVAMIVSPLVVIVIVIVIISALVYMCIRKRRAGKKPQNVVFHLLH